jgi:Sulfotransferase family
MMRRVLRGAIVAIVAITGKKDGYKKCCCTSSFGIMLSLLLLLLIMWMSNDYFCYRSIITAHEDARIFNKKKKHNKEQPAASSLSSFPSVDFFDCHRNDSLCTFFQPRHFFQNGSGKAAFMREHDFERLGGSNPNLPACTGLSWWSTSPTLQDFNNNNNNNTTITLSLVPSTTTTRNNNSNAYWHNLSFIHIHKCGGTTIQATMRALQTQIIRSSSSLNNVTCNVETYKYSIGGGSKRQKEVNSQKRLAHIQDIARAQQQQQQHQQHDTALTKSGLISSVFPVFTIVRDPVDRFLSAFQQVMHYNDDLRSTCLKRTAKATIQCVIEFVRQKTNYNGNGGGGLDVHLVPMAMHLRLFHETDIVISVFHLKDIRAISQYLQFDSGSSSSSFPFFSSSTTTTMMSRNNNSITSTGTATAATAPVIHIHDRSQVKFATSKVLATMSAVKDCDSKMLQDICDLYAVDVAMMHSLGFETTYCSSSPSFSY